MYTTYMLYTILLLLVLLFDITSNISGSGITSEDNTLIT